MTNFTQVQGGPADQLDFYRPDGTYLGTTYPAEAKLLLEV